MTAMRSHEEKVSLAARIVADRFGKKAPRELRLRVDEWTEYGEFDAAQFWQHVADAVNSLLCAEHSG